MRSGVVPNLEKTISVMNGLVAHRGPDGNGQWFDGSNCAGLGHTRLAIIDLSDNASQPMVGKDGSVISYNGELYNYPEIRDELRGHWDFSSTSDTECVLASYARYGPECLSKLRGMFSFAIWNQGEKELFCARDRFGIKPFYYLLENGCLYFASEAKALLPFVSEIKTDEDAFAEYVTFQYSIGEKTLFKGIKQLLPGHALTLKDGRLNVFKYWDVFYGIDWNHSSRYFEEELRELVSESVSVHLRSDVEVGAYVSGGIDSSLMLNLGSQLSEQPMKGFHGRFTEYEGYDESSFAQAASKNCNAQLHVLDIFEENFISEIESVIYHLDYPVAGPGSFPQYMVSKMASEHVKVVLGGQGGDEVFGGYARYVIAYLEQCLLASINGTSDDGNYVVTLESIIPNLGLLKEYKPLIKQFWAEGLFEPMDQRYFRLSNRSNDVNQEIEWRALNMEEVFIRFQSIFNNEKNVGKEAYFDKMTHFDFKGLLPALLQVEDRMSMAHGIESRVPLLDHSIVEFAATIPADVKFKDGNMKFLLKKVFADLLPKEIVSRRDKMGFPVPLKEWMQAGVGDFVRDVFSDGANRKRDFINHESIVNGIGKEGRFSRKLWGLLSLELWHQQFHDKQSFYRSLL